MLDLLEVSIGSEAIQSEVEQLRLCLEKCRPVLFIILYEVLWEEELEFLEKRGPIKLFKDLENSVFQGHWLALRHYEKLFKQPQRVVLQ